MNNTYARFLVDMGERVKTSIARSHVRHKRALIVLRRFFQVFQFKKEREKSKREEFNTFRSGTMGWVKGRGPASGVVVLVREDRRTAAVFVVSDLRER